MSATTKLTRTELAKRLQVLSGELQFTCGQPASWSDGLIEVSVDRVGDDAAAGNHLLTVFAGFPPVPEVHGLVLELRRLDDSGDGTVRLQTDRRGQVWLRGLRPGTYCIHFSETRASVIYDPASYSMAADNTGDRQWAAETPMGTLQIAGEFVRVKCTPEEARYGIVRLYSLPMDPEGEKRTPAGIWLLPMPLYRSRSQTYRLGQMTLAALTGGTKCKFKIEFVPANDTTLDQFPRAEVEQLQQNPPWADDEELAARLDELLQRLRSLEK